MTRLQTAFAAIDQANSADPNRTDGQPNELLYGQRMTAEQQALYPEATDPLTSVRGAVGLSGVLDQQHMGVIGDRSQAIEVGGLSAVATASAGRPSW